MRKELTVCGLILITLGCTNSGSKVFKESSIVEDLCQILTITGDISSDLQVDSIFDMIEAIPLETKDKYLITEIIKARIVDEMLILQDKAERLFVFDLHGKFLNEISAKGRGPGEFSELRDFEIDNEKHLYILDFERIHIYSIDGAYIKTIRYSFSPENEVYCNPIQFAVAEPNRFYIWGGSFGINENEDGKHFAMYELDDQGKVRNRYFPVNHVILDDRSRFSTISDTILINPVFGSYDVYSIDNVCVKKRYHVDFGEKAMPVSIPPGFQSLATFKDNVDKQYYHSIKRWTESSEWIYFMFFTKDRAYNAYYSKRLKKSFLSRQWPLVEGEIAPYSILFQHNEKMISFCNPQYLLEQMEACKKKNFDLLSSSARENLIRLRNIKISDNPVLIFCSMKKY
jgi:hypothetical protein